jgi:hypothetical protein
MHCMELCVAIWEVNGIIWKPNASDGNCEHQMEVYGAIWGRRVVWEL